MKRLPILLLCFASASQAYITSPGALPTHRQIKWLQEMTGDICQAKPGQLSHLQLYEAPELMHAWSQVQVEKDCAALAVESLVKRLIDERRAGNTAAQTVLATEDYNCLLQGWVRSGQGMAAAERCQQILQGMHENGPAPNLDSFKCGLMAWRQACVTKDETTQQQQVQQQIPVRAQQILEWMIRSAQEGGNEHLMPDSDCFDTCLQIWSRSRHPQAPQKSEQLLGLMEKLHRSTNNPKLQPRRTSFNAVLTAHAQSGQAHRSLAILSFMELLAANGDATVAPDAASYHSVLTAVSKMQQLQLQAPPTKKQQKQQAETMRAAEAIVRHAEVAYQSNPDGGQLDDILFNTAMGICSKSHQPEAYRHARALLDRQQDWFEQQGCTLCQPDVVSYTTVIASCASEPSSKASQRADAFQVAMDTYQQLQKQSAGNVQPNHITFAVLLKACARLLPAGPNRTRWARRIFRDCVSHGCVGDLALMRLRACVTPQVYEELVPKELPAKWTMHAQENKKNKQQNNYYNPKQHKKQKRHNGLQKQRRRAEI